MKNNQLRPPWIGFGRKILQLSVLGGLLLAPSSMAGETGKLTREVWNNIAGSQVSDLTLLPNFHGGSDSSSEILGAEAPSNAGDNYGTKLRGYLIAPVTGDYTFFESGDDSVELWMSTDFNKFHAERIAYHKGWTNPRQWDKFPTQKSEEIRLTAGQKCYIELRHKEGVGGDNLALGWSYREVQVSSNLTQLPGVVATQSSTYWVWNASHAIDGNTGGDAENGDNISHTQNSAGSWWKVDLAGTRSVERIVLWNREGWNGRRLSNFRVSILNDLDETMVSKDFFTDGTHAAQTVEWMIPGGTNARSVKVERIGPSIGGENILQLAEVEVFGVDTIQPTINLAQLPGVTASQSSTYWIWNATHAIDGNTGGDTGAGDSITHTQGIAGSWWQADLGQPRVIEELKIWNREGWNGRRLSNFRVSFLDPVGNVVRSQDYFTDGTHAGQTVQWDIAGGVYAQFVKIERIGPSAGGENFLQLAEVQVFGPEDRLSNVTRQLVDSSALESYDIDPLDADDDDLLDAWETTHGFDTSTWQDGIYAYSADSDGDYLTNYEESQLGLNPFQPDSLPGFLTLETRLNISSYSVYEAAQDFDKIYQTPDDIFLTPGATTGERQIWYFAQKLRGYLEAPVTGNYRFWVSGTNGIQLFLSAGDDKYRKQLIAEMGPEAGTGHGANFYDVNKWDRFVTQMSEEVHLVAGQKYYLEVSQQHGHGHYANASVAWALPGAERVEVPSSAVSSYFPVSTDADDDSLLDTWETQYGLSVTDNGLVDRSKEGENGDFDSDGINNREEYIAGTDPADADTDGDGLSDGDEVHSHGTDPLQSDAPSETVAATVDVSTYLTASHSWSMVDGGLLSDSFRGDITWNFSVPSSGTWVIQVDTRIRGTAYSNELVHVNASVDGVFVGRYAIQYGASHKGIMRVLSPSLSSGTHTLKLEIDNLLGRRTVQIDSITLRNPSGVDLDGNGVIDWVEDELAEEDFVMAHATTSRTSPFCLEGRARIPESMQFNGGSVLIGGDPNHWYANLSMQDGYDTAYTVVFANGQTVSGEAFWWATNVLDNESLTIRTGDTLRLGAWVGNGNNANSEHPNKKTSQGNGVVSTITVNGVDHTLGNSRDTHNHLFSTAGVYTITATHTSGATGTLTVTVKGATLPDDVTVMQNSVSYLTLADANVDRSLYFEGGSGLGLGTLEDIDGSNFKFRMYPSAGGELGVVARLWENGPILDVAEIQAVTVTDALQNGLTTVISAQDYDDYYIVNTPMVVLDLPPGGEVVVTIYRSGVTFLDGTKQKTYTEADFTNGIVNLQFLMPKDLQGGYCHSVDIFDGNGAFVGRR